jgi:hypothetical protein
MPWLYELAMEVYRAVKAGDSESIERELHRIRRFSELMMRGPWMEELGFGRKDYHMIAMEFPRMLQHALRRSLEMPRPAPEKVAKPPLADGDTTG